MQRTGLPIELGPVSNGEYAPARSTQLTRKAAADALDIINRGAARSAFNRRQFIRWSGTAAVLAAVAACSKQQSAASGPSITVVGSSASPTTVTTTAPGGTFLVPEEATEDPEAAADALSGAEFVFDVQTHLLEYNESNTDLGYFGSGFPQASCGLDDPLSCFSIDQWKSLVLDGSDTAIAVLSAVPIAADNSPLSTRVMERARREAAAAGCDGRVLIQGEAFPGAGSPDVVFAGMAQLAADYDIAAWKTYTHAGNGWTLDDSLGEPIGQRFIDRVRELGPPIIAVHKGFSGGGGFGSPADIGPAAARNPDISFLVYHSGFEPGRTESAYVSGNPTSGIDELVASLEHAGVGPSSNVYAELGSTWFNLIRDPTQAAHALGKLVNAVGPDRLLWGTDSIWYGSPQSQIEAFRTFEISEEFQEVFGYPTLSPGLKAAILGRNAAALHNLSPGDCIPSRADENATVNSVNSAVLGPATAAGARSVFTAAHPWFAPRSTSWSA